MRYFRPLLRRKLTAENFIFLTIFASPFILFAPEIFSGKTLFWGTAILQFLPWRYLAWEMIRGGSLPLWNPYVGMGAPLLANYQTGVLYPPNWILFLFDAIGGVGWMGWGHAVLVAFHLAWAGWGMVKLAKSLGVGEVGQAIAGLSFGLSGYLVSRVSFFSINSTVVWLPWILYYCIPVKCEEEYSGGKLWRLLKLTLSMSMLLLAGHAQTAWYIILFGILWGVFIRNNQIAHSYRSDKGALKKIRVLATDYLLGSLTGLFQYSIALLGAIALASAQLLPTLEYLINSQRSTMVPSEQATTYSYWPWRLLTLLAPRLFGSPVKGNYWGYGNYWEDALYFGMLPLIAFISSFLLNKSEKKRMSDRSGDRFQNHLLWFIGLCIIFSMALALGKNTSIFPFFYEHIPTFNMFQAPTRFSIWAQFGFSLVAGVGVSQWRKPVGKCLYWTRLSIAAAFAVILGSGLAWLTFGKITQTIVQATALAGFWAMGTGFLIIAIPDSFDGNFNSNGGSDIKFQKAALWGIGVIIFVALDLLITDWGLNPGIGQKLLTKPAFTSPYVEQLVGENRIYLPPQDEYDLKFTRFMRFDSYNPGEDWENLRSVLLPNVNILDQVASANNFDPLVTSRYEKWMEHINEVMIQGQDSNLQTLLNLSGIGAVETIDNSAMSGVVFNEIKGSRYLRFVPCMYEANGAEEALKMIDQGEFNPDQSVVIENSEREGNFPRCKEMEASEEAGAAIQEIEKRPNKLALVIENQKPGFLVISETWYPGWVVEINGKRGEILKANYLFRGLFLEPGINSIVFLYHPESFYWGSIISICGLIGFLSLILYNIRRQRDA